MFLVRIRKVQQLLRLANEGKNAENECCLNDVSFTEARQDQCAAVVRNTDYKGSVISHAR